MTASICLVGTQLWQVPPAVAAGLPVCVEAGVGEDVTNRGTETPEVCPYVDRGVLDSVLPPDPGVWAALPATAKDVFRPARVTAGPNVFEPRLGTSLLPGENPARTSANCGSDTVTIKGENSLGGVLYVYAQRLEYCIKGDTIVSLRRTRWGKGVAPGWTFEGHIESWKSGHPPAREIGRYTKGRFSFGVAFVFLQYEEPWIEMWVSADDSRWDGGEG